MNRVAVQVGGAWLRVAAEGRLLGAWPASGVQVAAVLDGLFDAPVDELCVVLPVGGTAPDRAVVRAELVRAGVVGAGVVRAVPAAVAALAGHPAPPGAPLRRAVVVDLGFGGTEIARVEHGRVVAAWWVPVGGAGLDAITAAVLDRAGLRVPPERAREVREALSLLPAAGAGVPPQVADALHAALATALSAVVEAVRVAVRAGGSGSSPPVLLIGGVARSPLPAELLDAAGIDDVRVAPRPDTAAVTGALLVAGAPVAGAPHPVVGYPAPRVVPPSTCLPPVAPRRGRSRRVLAALAGAAALAGLLGAGAAVPAATRARSAVGEVVQYGYAVDLPQGWAHTGGLPERRRSLLTPVSAPDGSDLISVERTPLGYDADAEPRRARDELHATFDAAVAAGAPLSGFTDDAQFAGRPVVAYREDGGTSATGVDWYVVLAGDAQLSVGCRHTRAGADAVRAACATVVGSARRTA